MNNEPVERRPVPALAGGVQAPIPSSDSGMSISDIFRILFRSKWVIMAFIVAGLGASIAYVKLKTPIYEATVDLQIDPGRVNSLGLSELLSLAGGNEENNEVATQSLILKSQTVVLSSIASMSPEDQRQLLGTSHLPDFSQPDSIDAADREAIIRSIQSRLGIKNIEGTQLVTVSFRDPHPRLAARFANDLVAAYITNNFNSRYNSVRQVSMWLAGQMRELQNQSDQAQRDLSAFQQQNNILGADINDNTTVDRLKQLNTELTQSQADQIAAEAKYRIALTGDPRVLATLSSDVGLQTLEGQKAQLLVQAEQLSSKFGPNYPPLAQLRSQTHKLDTEIDSELSKVTARLKEDLDTASVTESMLKKQYDQQSGAAFGLNRNVAEYMILRDREQSSRDLYDMLQFKLQQAGIDAGLGSVDTTIVDKASVPASPAEPRVFLTLALGTCIGLVSGVGAALLSEATNDTVRDLDNMEAISRLPLLGAIPRFDRRDMAAPVSGLNLTSRSSGSAMSSVVTIHQPQSASSEAFRGLRNAVILSSLDRDLKSLLITSSVPQEGKSTIAANYAVSLAQRGAKVLLMDIDLRRPAQHTLFRTSNRTGLSSWLAGGEPVILKPVPELPSLHLVPAGPRAPSPAEVLTSDRVRTLIAELKEQYDYIVLDSAPVLIVSDAVPVAAWVDGVLVIARFNSTPIKALSRAVAILRRANANARGVILNGVTNDVDGYYYYGKYSGTYYEQV